MIIWLASYPRSGNTLLRIILKSVFQQRTFSKYNDVNDIGADARTAEEVGHLGLTAAWDEAYKTMLAGEHLHLVKTHDAPEDSGKAIYVVRDGRSTCRSFHHYMKDFPFLAMEYTVRDVVAGFTPFGSWGNHLETWQPLQRPDTLLVKYEDLVGNPSIEIQRIASFTGLTPLADWHNNFEQLHELNPRFFRAGALNDPASALEPEDDDIFWAQHGDWMRRLDYPEPPPAVGHAHRAFRQFISRRGREQFFLREQIHFVGQEVGQLRAQRALDAEAQARVASELAAASTRVQELESQIQRVRQELVDARAAAAVELQVVRQDLIDARAVAASLELVRQELVDARAAGADLEGVRKELIEARAARAELLIVRQELSDARGVRSEMEIVRRELREAREAHTQLEAVRQELIEAQRASADLEVIRQELLDTRAAREQETQSVGQLRSQLDDTHSELVYERSRTSELQRIVDEAARLAESADTQNTAALNESGKTVDLLLEAIQKLEDRLRLLLSSRLLRSGWRVGLGSTPHWADPERDDLVKGIKVLRQNNDMRRSPQSLSRIVDLAKDGPPRETDMDRALQHLTDKGFRPKVVLDIGAAKGYWTLQTAWRWKDANFFMIDPLQESEPELQKICQDPRFRYLLTAVGKEPGELVMNVTADCDGSSLLGFSHPDPARQRRIRVARVDDLLSEGRLSPPELVKLDVQGFELNVLEGGQRLFDTAEVFIVEVNLFPFMLECPRVHEVVKYMADRKFYLFDIAGSLRRPYQNDLGQMDLVFVADRSSMTASNRWS